MKIACVLPDHLSTLIFCKTLSRLLDLEHNIQLFTISGRADGLPGVDYIDEIHRDVISHHIDIPMKRFMSPIKDFFYLIKLYRTLRIGCFTTVITFTTKPNIIGQFAAFLAGVPFRIMAVRGLGRTFNTPTSIKDKSLQYIMKVLYKFSCHLSNRVWLTNRGDLNDFLSLRFINKNKSFLTKNAVDLDDFCEERINDVKIESLRQELGLNKDNKVVIMVARLIKEKGVIEFTEAAKRLRGQLPHLHFLLVAPEEPFNPSIVHPAYLRKMEACSNFNWLGFRKDVRELYALSNLAVLPSYYKEGGYPRALLEAMAYGKPVIAADTPECRGPVKNGSNGYLVPPKDSKALANAIKKIIVNPALSKKMGAHSLLRMKSEFDDKLIFNRLINEVILRPFKYRQKNSN